MRSSALVLLVCAGVLLSGGSILGLSTIWSLLRMSYYLWTSDLGAELGSVVLFVAGALLCLPTCWLATLVPYHPKSLSLTSTLMFVTMASMLLLSTGLSALSGLSRVVREPSALNTSLLNAMPYETLNPAVRSAFMSMQLELRCCGVNSYADWYQHRHTLPASCCNRIWTKKHGEVCTTPIYTAGCLRPALNELRVFINSTTSLAAAIIIILAMTLFAAAYVMVTSVVEREEGRAGKGSPPPPALRVSCLPHAPPPPASLASTASPPPLFTVTSPTLLPQI